MAKVRALICCLALGFSNSVFAQSRSSNDYHEWEASGFVGASFPSTFHFDTPVKGSDQEISRTVGMHISAGYQFGARVYENVQDMWAAGLEYSFSHQVLGLTNLSPSVQSLSLNQYVHHISYDVAYLILPASKRFRPYAGAGLGTTLYYISKDSKDLAAAQGVTLQDSWKFLFNWGGGFRYAVTDEFLIGVDVKDGLSGVPSYGLPKYAQVVGGQFQPGMFRHGIVQNWKLNFGLTYAWDD